MARRESVAKLRWLLAVCTVLSLPADCLAGGRPARRIEPLVAKADRIVRGTVESVVTTGDRMLTVARDESGFQSPVKVAEVVKGGQLAGYRVAVESVRFEVTATLKGTAVTPGAIITVEAYGPYSGPAWGSLEVGQHGLLLLTADGGLAELYYPLLPIAADAPVLPGTLPPLDAVGQYFLLSLRPDTPPAVLESCLEGALSLGIAPQAVESLRTLAASSDPAVEGIGLRGLVEVKDAQGVAHAVAFLLSDRGASAPVPTRIFLGSAIGKLADPALAGAILPLLSAPEPSVRYSAVDALRRMKSLAAVPALMDMAKRPDLYEQWSALIALCDILGIESPDALGPSEEYEKNPQPYRDWWARWWETEGKAKYAAPAAQ